MVDADFIIPIDHVIDDFAVHLKSHERTILSAKFGDGKSYFLNSLMNNEEIKKDFVFLVLHPVNYQVVENKDIFELIKRDVLFQLVNNGIYNPEYEITNEIAFSFYLQNNFQSLASGLLPYLSYLNCDTKTTSALAAGLSSIKFLKDLRDKINNFKKENSESDIIDKFITKSKSFIYENDAITKIIRENICAYKKNNTNKRIVLIIEDMDRLDPAHLFRIMNIFSAQMDYQYLDPSDPNCDINGNKFGVDNVLMVMDYNNTNSIFSHFYGVETDFDGYIQKFCNKGIFKYSLKEQQEIYIYDKIQKVTELPLELVKQYITSEDLFKKTMRLICSSFDDVDSQIKQELEVDFQSNKYKLHLGILRIFVILRRLGESYNKMKPDDRIKERTISLISNNPDIILPYIAHYLLINSVEGINGGIIYTNAVGQKKQVYLNKINSNGIAEYQTANIIINSSPNFDILKDLIDKMLVAIST